MAYITVSSPDDQMWLVDLYYDNTQFSYCETFDSKDEAKNFGRDFAAGNSLEFVDPDGGGPPKYRLVNGEETTDYDNPATLAEILADIILNNEEVTYRTEQVEGITTVTVFSRH